jgi:hypothetical protein
LVFSLKLKEITANGSIPSIVFLERNTAYDWNKLPYGLSYLPTVTKDVATGNEFHYLKNVMTSYIKELYTLNHSSKFNLYCVDNYPEFILQMLVANQIPETNWTATMLSDGSGTAGNLCKAFAVTNPSTKLTEMEEAWTTVKNYIFKTGTYSNQYLHDNLPYSTSGDYSIMQYYPYAIIKTQANAHWWVNRLRTGENLSAITAVDSAFSSQIVSDLSATSFYTNNLLSALSDTEKTNFKSLYKFSDEMFKTAKDNGQKIMIILGTSWAGEKSTFYDYLKMTMTYYGKDYAYYYKGHPGYPTTSFPDRQTMLDKLNGEGLAITELDCAIAAEVILFYNPDVYVCGWQTTVFDSVESNAMACALYNTSKSNGSSLTYGELLDLYFSPLDLTSSIGTNVSLGLDTTHSYYLMEFNNTAAYEAQTTAYGKHEIGIYDSTAGTIKYYKLQDDQTTYEQVTVDGVKVV